MSYYAILVFVQLVFEAVPVSSSGHFLLLSLILDSYGSPFRIVDLPKFFDHFLHGGAVLVVLFLFFKDWSRPFVCLLSSGGILGKKNVNRMQCLFFIFLKIVGLVIIINLITVLFYLFYYGFLNDFVLDYSEEFLLLGFFITMLSLFSLRLKEGDFRLNDSLNFRKAFVLGVVQSMALFPGLSRFASTYVASRWLNLSARRAFQVSFLIQFPLNIASFFKGGWYLLKITNWYAIFNWEVNGALFCGIIISYFLLRLARWVALGQQMWLFGLYLFLPVFYLLIHLLLRR